MRSVILLVLACGFGSRPVVQTGTASFYGEGFEGRPTASGEAFDPEALTAAHPTLPLGTRVEVTRPGNGESVVVEINDRGPHTGGRIIDLSQAAATRLDFEDEGVAEVELRIVRCPEGESCEVP